MQPWKAWGNLDNITLEPLSTFYNVTLGTLKEPLQYNLGNLGKLGNLQGTLKETLKEPWGYLLGTLREPWQSNLGNLLETFTMSPWEPGPRLLGNLYIIILGTLTTFTWKTWDPCREPWRNLEGTFWEPFGNREGTLRNLGNLERTLGTLGTLSEPWEPWEPWETFTWEPLLGNLGTFTWEPLLGNLYLEPGNLGGMGFGAAPVCSETFTMAEDPKAFCCWGTRNYVGAHLCKSGFAWACQINVVRISNQTRPWQSTVQECSIHQASGHLTREENFRVTSRILLSGSSQKPANQAVQSKLEKIQEDLI